MSRRANAPVVALVLLAGVAGCPRPAGVSPGAAGADGGDATAPDATATAGDEANRAAPDGAEPGETAATVAPPPEEPLVAEEREKDPRSEKVTVTVVVEPRSGATRVTWGARSLGAPPLKLERDRYSGPLDLVITSPGYLVAHTRAFTDRDDVVTVRLVPVKDAARMHGYRSQAGVPKPATPPAAQNRRP